MDRGAWWATAHGITKKQTQLGMHVCTRIRAHTHTHECVIKGVPLG